MKYLTCIFIFLSGVMVLLSCRTDEIVGYAHDPSGKFYKEKNFGDDYLEKFKDERILFVLDVKKARENKCLLWLGLYSREKKSVTLIESRILNDNWVKKSKLDREVVIESTQSDAGLMKDSVQLFNIEGDLLDQVVEDGSNIRMEVIYSIDGVRKTMEFVLERRVEKHTVFRT